MPSGGISAFPAWLTSKSLPVFPGFVVFPINPWFLVGLSRKKLHIPHWERLSLESFWSLPALDLCLGFDSRAGTANYLLWRSSMKRLERSKINGWDGMKLMGWDEGQEDSGADSALA